MKEGYLVINKPDGITSHDVVAKVRKKFKMRRVGHAGTLDPLATGVLVILLGKATKLFGRFSTLDKGYKATLILGTVTDTADTQGEVVRNETYEHITKEQVKNVFSNFLGKISQVPPMYSAVRHKGKKLYELAREGITVERKAKEITIHELKLEKFNPPEVTFFVHCSKGTYIRQLAHDIGEMLGCGACISQIQRTKVGSFDIKEAIDIDDIHENHIRHWKN